MIANKWLRNLIEPAFCYGPFTLSVFNYVCDWFFWCLPSPNVNRHIEINGTHSVTDANTSEIAQTQTLSVNAPLQLSICHKF